MWRVKKRRECFEKNWPTQVAFAALITLQAAFAYFFWLAYGTMAFLLGPLRTWSTVLSAFLWYQAVTLPDHCLRYVVHCLNLFV